MTLLATISRVVAEAFVAGLWQGMVLVLVVAGILRTMPRLGAGARFGAWGLTFLAAVGVPFVHFSGVASGAGSGLRVGLGWGVAVAAVWGLLMVVRMGRLVGQGVQLRRIWKDAVPVEVGEEVAALLAEMPRRPALCVSGAVDAPSVIGFWSPKLLIPEWQVGSLREGEMRQIVLHECEHLRRRDDWMNLAQKVGLAMFPLNPALLWADRRLSLERELACDAGVVARTRAPFDYAECLTRLAEQRLGRRSLGLALSAWGRESELGRRVHRLLRPVGSMGMIARRVSFGVLAAALAGGSVELARMPRLVSFGDLGTVEVAASVEREPVVSGGRMMPVVYREPVRAKADGGQRPTASRRRAVVRRGDRSLSMVPRVRTVRVASNRQAGLVLTSAQVRTASMRVSPAELDGFRVVNAVATDFSVSYAAVPFANGWLILQL